MTYLAKNYNRKKIAFKYGKGSYLFSRDNKKYLDFVQGIAVNSLGQKSFGMFQMPFKFRKEKNWQKESARKHLQIMLCFKIVVQRLQKQQ